MKAPIILEQFDWKENEEFPFTLSSLMISLNAVLFRPNFEIHVFFSIKIYQYITRLLIIPDTFWNSQCLILNYQIVQSSHWFPFYSLHLHFWLLWPNKQFPAKTITWNKKDTGKIKVNSDYFKYRMQHKHNVSWIFPYLRKTNKIREIFPKNR